MFTLSKQDDMAEFNVVNRIAEKLKATRLKRNMTIQQLAQRTQLSKGLLSKIENSRTIPSLPVFVSLVHSMDISLREFFQDLLLQDDKPFILIKRGEGQLLRREGRPGFNYQSILSHHMAESTLEINLLNIDPHATGEAITTDGYEFKFMLRGSCTYTIGNDAVLFEEGDSLYFNASIPHFPANQSDVRCEMLVLYFLS